MEAVFVLSGEIDVATGEADRDAAETFVASAHGPVWVVDMTDVTFMDSTGLGLLVYIRGQASSRGATVTLRSPSSAVVKLLTTTALTSLFEIEPPP